MATLTIHQKIETVNNFINSLKDNKNSYYCFVGRAEPWKNSDGTVNEDNIPESDSSITQIEQLIYHDMVFAKKLAHEDSCFMTKRFQWSSGTTYTRYDNNDPYLYMDPNNNNEPKNFFVINDANEVYKCIYNGFMPSHAHGVPSTVKPSVKNTKGTFKTADGYIWKYMFTCDPAVFENFATPNYIPVTPNTEVKTNAIPGTIDNIVIMDGGSNFQVFEEGFVANFVNNSVITLPRTSSPLDDFYTGSSIYIKSGFGAGQIRPIVKYIGGNKQLAVNPEFKYYQNLKLDPNFIFGGDSFAIGDTVSQLVSLVIYYNNTGYFNSGDKVYQTDTGAYGEILFSNSVTYTIQNETDTVFELDYPLINLNDIPDRKYGKFDAGVSKVTSTNFNIVANTTGVDNASNTIKLLGASTYLNVGDAVYYNVPTGDHNIPGLTGNTAYYVVFANATDFAVSTTLNGSRADLTATNVYNETHIITKDNSLTTLNYPNLLFEITNASYRITANTSGVDTACNTIKVANASSIFNVNDRVYYHVPVTNTAIPGLIRNTNYYVTFTNTTDLAVSVTPGGTNADLTTITSGTGEFHTLSSNVVSFGISPNTSGVNSTDNSIKIANASMMFAQGDSVYYLVPTSGIAINRLTSNTIYYIASANNTDITLALTRNKAMTGDKIQLTESRTSANTHYISQYAPSQYIKIGGSQNIMLDSTNIRRITSVSPNTITIDTATPINSDTIKIENTYYIEANTQGVDSDQNVLIVISADKKFIVGDTIYYYVPTSNTAVGGLTGNSNYFVSFVNSTSIGVAGTYENSLLGTKINLTETRTDEIGEIHTIKKTVFKTVSNPVITSNVDTYSIGSAAVVESVISHHTVGHLIYKNLDSVELSYNNITPAGASFVIGEMITCIDSEGISQNAEGTLSFANSSYMILSNFQGPGVFRENFRISGNSSFATATINKVETYPNITVETDYGSFVVNTPHPNDPAPGKFLNGTKIQVSTQGENAIPVGNAKVISSFTSPDDLSEYIIAPTVTITGDGVGASAYSTVDLTDKNPRRSITGITLINNGNNYNYANVTISSNVIYGLGANVVVQISPVEGHGYDPYSELGSFYCGINKKFNIASSEAYEFPMYGEYRKIGVVKNPKFNDVIINAANFEVVGLQIKNLNGAFIVGETVIQPNTHIGKPIYYITANTTGFDSACNTIKLANANNVFDIDEIVYYEVPDGQTAIAGLDANTSYYVTFANGTDFALSDKKTGEIDQVNRQITDIREDDPAEYHIIYSNNSITDGAVPAGIVTYANTSYVELKNARGKFLENVNHDTLYGLVSTTTANCKSANVKYFTSIGNLETIADNNLGGTGSLTQPFFPVNGTQKIKLTNVVGSFTSGDQIFESVSNAYANITSIFTSNGTIDRSSTFGLRAIQTARITLTSNTRPFNMYEYVDQQEQGCYGRIISNWNELDITYLEEPEINFVVGEEITCEQTGATATITFVDTSAKYIKLSVVSQEGFDEVINRPFNPQNIIRNSTSVKTTTINNVYNVLVLDDVNGNFITSNLYQIVGRDSNATAFATLENAVKMPDFVKNSGKVLYLENLAPFTKTKDSTEQVKLIIKF